jgi:hypothetical protein
MAEKRSAWPPNGIADVWKGGGGRQWTFPACSGISTLFQVKAAAAQVGDHN